MRLFAERSLYLAQRMPFLMRWQAEVYTGNALATREAQQTQAQLEQMSLILTEASRMLAGMVDQVSQERQAALDDLFAHIETERKGSLDQVTAIVQKERASTLEQVGLAIDAQRKALFEDLAEIAGSAERTGSAWIVRTLLIGGVLIAMLLLGLLGTMLVYRRLLPFVDRRGAFVTA
jgi:CHASE3 domain sensor protein